MILEFLVIVIGILFSHILDGSTLFELNSIKPEFVIIFLVYFSIKKGPFVGIWIGFFAGLLVDANLGILTDEITNQEIAKIGFHSFAYSILGFVYGTFLEKIYQDNYLAATLVAFLGSFVSRLIVYILFYIFQANAPQDYSIFLTSVYTAILAPVWFMLLGWLYKVDQGAEV